MSKFADPSDEASQQEEAFTQQSIEAVLSQGNQPQRLFKGTCYNCGGKVSSPWRFCDSECLEEYDYIQERRRANGNVR